MRGRQILLTVLLVFAAINGAEAQKLKDRINNKLSQLKGDDQDTVAMDDRSMTEIAKGWETGEYKRYSKYTGMNTWDPETDKIYLHFDRNEQGEVTAIRHGEEVIYATFEPYTYGGSDFVGCYFENALNIIHLTDESVICYHLDSEYRVAGLKWCAGKKVKYKPTIGMIQALRDHREKTVEGDREAIAQEEIEHRAKYTLEGKNVASIEAVFPDGKPGHLVDGSSVDIGFKITLDDGTVMKTSNIGGHAYVEDLVEEGENCYISGVGSDYSPATYGANPKTKAVLRGNVHNFSKDKATVTIKPKYGGSAVLTLDFTVLFKDNEIYSCEGEDGYPGYAGGAPGGRAGHGCPVDVEIKLIKHTVTGDPLYIARIKDNFTGKVTKIKFNSGLQVNVRGGMGGTGANGSDKQSGEYGVPGKGGTGGTGGNGGDINLVLDPSAKNVDFTYKNGAGSGGNGGRGGTCWSCPNGDDGPQGDRGASGSSGSFDKTIRSVNL